jgi:hypothetical protein
MKTTALALLALLLLPACPDGGSPNCTATYSCENGACACEDGSACDDPAEADASAEANCLNACEVCEE